MEVFMTIKQYRPWAVIILGLALILSPQLGWAQETTDPTLDDPVAESSLNAVQQSRVDNLAQLSVELNPDEGLQELGDTVADLEAQLEAMDPEDPNYEDLETQLDQARTDLTDALAEAVGAKAAEIEAMREDMGWGEICHELGLHPSVLGKGHMNAYGLTARTSTMTKEKDQVRTRTRTRTRTRDQLSKPTDRSLKGGLAKGHGLSSKGETSNGKGLGAEKSKAGLGGASVAGGGSHGHGYGGKSPDAGKGSDKSQGKSEGKGKGKGKGNSKSK
jgi:hypothetical protein